MCTRGYHGGVAVSKIYIIKKRKTDKNMYSHICFSPNVQLQRALITIASSKNCSVYQSSAYMRIYYHHFKPNIWSAHIQKYKINFTWSYMYIIIILVNIWKRKKEYTIFAWSITTKPLLKCWTVATFGDFIMFV